MQYECAIQFTETINSNLMTVLDNQLFICTVLLLIKKVSDIWLTFNTVLYKICVNMCNLLWRIFLHVFE